MQVAADQLDVAFVAVPAGTVEGVTVRSINRQEILIVMSPVNPLAKMDRVPIESLRGEPIIAVSSATKSPYVDAARKWIAMRLGEEPNIVAEEPPDQIPAAVAQSAVAIAFTTETRAAAMSAAGLTCRPISPAPVVEYGVAYRQGAQSATSRDYAGLDEDHVDGARPDVNAAHVRPLYSSTVCDAMLGHPKVCTTRCRPAFPILAARSGSLNNS